MLGKRCTDERSLTAGDFYLLVVWTFPPTGLQAQKRIKVPQAGSPCRTARDESFKEGLA
jgi:hypothetical protein